MEHQVILFSGLLLGAVYALSGLQLLRWLSRLSIAAPCIPGIAALMGTTKRSVEGG